MNTDTTKLTIGIDLGDKRNSICVVDGCGEVIERIMVTNSLSDMAEYFSKFTIAGDVRVGMEAGTHSPWISDFLTERGFDVLVGNARKMRSIWQSNCKDDIRDAEMIARLCRFDRTLLSPIIHRGRKSQADLGIIKARHALVRTRSGLVNAVRGLAKSTGTKLSACSTDAFPNKVAPEIPDQLKVSLDPLLETIGELSRKIRHYDRVIDDLSKEQYPETEILRQVPGIGPVTALAFVLTIEDPVRFKKCRAIGPFLGLVPKRDQSGQSDKPLSITKAGNVYLRQLLVGSANYIMGPFCSDCDLRRQGERLAGRGATVARRKAKVAVARKLAVLLLHLWKSKEVYDPHFKDTQKTQKRKAA